MEKWSDIEGVLPETVEEGKKYYKFYKEVHHQRGKKFAPDELIKNKTSLACFGRTGSNWFKYTLEEMTGFYLADDHYADQESIQWLISKGELLGMGKNSPVIKTHYPFVPNQRTNEDYSVNRVIIQTRNPINCIMSLFNLVVVDHHVNKLPSDFYLSDPVYDKILRIYIKRWAEINEFWENQGIPYVCLRYEDLTENLKETLLNMYSFINGEEVRGTPMEKTIEIYAHRKGKASFYRKGVEETRNLLAMHSKEQIRFIYDNTKELLSRFGYIESYEEFLGIPPEQRIPSRLDQTFAQNREVIDGICSGKIKTDKNLSLGDTTNVFDEEYERLRPEMMSTKERLTKIFGNPEEEAKENTEEKKVERKLLRTNSLDGRTAKILQENVSSIEQLKEKLEVEKKQNQSRKEEAQNAKDSASKQQIAGTPSPFPMVLLGGAFLYLFCL